MKLLNASSQKLSPFGPGFPGLAPWRLPIKRLAPFQTGGASSHIVRLLQHGLIASAPLESEAGFGLGSILHHDAPRRLQVAGRDIRHGARLELFTHDDPERDEPPSLGLPPEDPAQVRTHKLSLPLYPTGEIHGGLRGWETAVEFEPSIYYRLVLGGERAPGVAEALEDYDFEYFEPPDLTFDAGCQKGAMRFVEEVAPPSRPSAVGALPKFFQPRWKNESHFSVLTLLTR